MNDTSRSHWWDEISRDVHQREIHRQILFERLRGGAARLYVDLVTRTRVPTLFPEYLKTLTGSLLGLWIITTLPSFFFHWKPIYTLAAFGFVYSLQSTYHKYRLSIDPAYRIPKCRCGGAAKDHSEVVLKSKASSILGVPNSVLGAVLYAALVWLVAQGHAVAAMITAIVAVSVSAYLGYIMVVRTVALCSNCINIAAVNCLILFHFLH